MSTVNVNEIEAPSLLEMLYERLGDQENLELEFKASRNALPRDLWETVSAFANTQGGWVILGIEQRGEKFEVSGVSDASVLLDSFYSTIRNPQKISYSVCGANDAKVEELDSGSLVILRIPAAPRKNRPVYIGNNPYTGTFLRRNSGDYKCNKQEVDQMMREASVDSATSTMLISHDLTDIDLDALRRYRQRYQTAQPGSVLNSYDDKEFLRAIRGFQRDRNSGREGLTVAGLLMFGKETSLLEWRSRHLIDYRLVRGGHETEDRRWEDRIAWQGNLFEAYEKIYPKLIQSQPVPFKIENGIRVDDPPSHVALREALVNLLVHADYAEPDASLIIQSPEGYLFRNPGSSRVLESDLLTGNRSDPRNPELVRMFRFIGACDEGGTGIPKIIASWKSLGFKIPTIDVGTERYEFTIRLRQVHLISEEDLAWLGTLDSSLSEAERLSLVIAKYDGDVDNFRLRQVTNQHSADVTKILRGLRSRDLLRMIGSGHKAKYELGPAAVDNLFFSPPLQEPYEPSNSYTSNEASYTSSENPYTTSSGSYRTLEATTVWDTLEQRISAIKGQRRVSPSEREASIISLLEVAPLSMQDLKRLTSLSEPYLRQILQSLAQKGDIVFLFPQQPSHPSQKYCLRSRVDQNG